jgi:hypothetical protein
MISRDGLRRCTRLGHAKSSKLVELPPIPARHDAERSTSGRMPAEQKPQEAVFRVHPARLVVSPLDRSRFQPRRRFVAFVRTAVTTGRDG